MLLHPNSSYDQMCISKRQKSDIIIIHIMRQPKPVSWFWNHIHSLEHAETKKYISISIIIVLRKINGLVCKTFTLEQKSGFKLERNKDLTFIVIIIDIDWYGNNYRD